MARLSPSTEVLRALFARSGNQCAFPGCTQTLINQKNQFIAHVCHIEAAMPGGERYNKSQTDEQRRDYKNLLLLCYPHHIETNDVVEYTVDRLRGIKFEHEQRFHKADFKIDESELYRLSHEMERFWNDIERINRYDHSILELAFDVNAKATGCEVIDSAWDAVRRIEEFLKSLQQSDEQLPKEFVHLVSRKGIDPAAFADIPYYENPFENRNWETHNLGLINWMQSLRISLTHIEVKYLEEYLKTNGNDVLARSRLERVKGTMKELAQHAVRAD